MIKMRIITKGQVINRAYRRRSAERLRKRELRAERQRRREWIEKERLTRMRYYFKRLVDYQVVDDWFTHVMDEHHERMSALFAPLVKFTLSRLEEAHMEGNDKKAGEILREGTVMSFLIANQKM